MSDSWTQLPAPQRDLQDPERSEIRLMPEAPSLRQGEGFHATALWRDEALQALDPIRDSTQICQTLRRRLLCRPNASHHRTKKIGRGTSAAFCSPCACNC